jgi:hypothetical protein
MPPRTAVASFGDGFGWFLKFMAWASAVKFGYELLVQIVAFFKRHF